jgi:hypothetical protein
MIAANLGALSDQTVIKFMALSKFFTYSVYIFNIGAYSFIISPILDSDDLKFYTGIQFFCYGLMVYGV